MQNMLPFLSRILRAEVARKQAAAAIEERNKTSRVQLAPPKTYSQYREQMYGKGTKDSDLSGKQKSELAKDYIKNLEEIAYIDSSKSGQPNRFYQGFEQSVLPQGYFQGNKRRYKTGGLVIAQEEANSNKPRGARKELKGTKFKGVF